MKRKIWLLFAFIIILAGICFYIDLPSGSDLKIGKWTKELKIHRGLDLQGGSHLVYELDTTNISESDKNQAIQSVIDVIDRRINVLGVSEPVIQSSTIGDKASVIVELPGIKNVDEAMNVIGKTAQLSFWQISNGGTWAPTSLTGANLKKADVTYNQTTNDPEISLEFNDKGKELFAEITKNNIGNPVAIVLDNEIISAPTVQTEISDGKAVISGQFTLTDAKNMAKLLNAGALPVPIKVVEQRNIEAALGIESVKASLFAGFLGLVLITIFMLIYYRLPGFIASIALFIYTLIMLALFKLIPVTLTMSGIAGFLLSIGMAIDANVIIFERLKEELRNGKTMISAIEDGFSRSWSSIRDSNITTLITSVILYFTTTGMVRGFALTLSIGVLVSMFSAITITRNFLLLIATTKYAKLLKWEK